MKDYTLELGKKAKKLRVVPEIGVERNVRKLKNTMTRRLTQQK